MLPRCRGSCWCLPQHCICSSTCTGGFCSLLSISRRAPGLVRASSWAVSGDTPDEQRKKQGTRDYARLLRSPFASRPWAATSLFCRLRHRLVTKGIYTDVICLQRSRHRPGVSSRASAAARPQRLRHPSCYDVDVLHPNGITITIAAVSWRKGCRVGHRLLRRARSHSAQCPAIYHLATRICGPAQIRPLQVAGAPSRNAQSKQRGEGATAEEGRRRLQCQSRATFAARVHGDLDRHEGMGRYHEEAWEQGVGSLLASRLK